MNLLLIPALLLSSLPASATVRVPAAALRSGAVRIAAPAVLPSPFLAPVFNHALQSPTLSPLALTAFADSPSLSPVDQVASRLRGTEIIIIQTVPGPNGRGPRIDDKLEALMKRHEGQVRGLERDGPAQIFADTFAIEVSAAAMEQVLAELQLIAGADTKRLSQLLALGSRRVAPEAPTAETLAGYAARIKEGSLSSRWTAFAELSSILEAASPAQLAALPRETRDALVIPLYGIAGDAVNAFNLVQGAARTDLRKAMHDARADDKEGWASLEKGAQEGLKHPGISSRFEPLRAHLTRAIATLDRLDTPGARGALLQILPHADYAGLQLASRSDTAAGYVDAWLDRLVGAIDETRRGLEAPAPAEGEKTDWHGSNRSGGYTHVGGRRQSSHLYQWRPYRFDPADAKNELLLLLGIPSAGVNLVEPLLSLLDFFQLEWPEMQELHKRKTLSREYAQAERNLEYYKKQAEQEGRPYTAEQVESIREQLRAQADERFNQHDQLDGHSVIDNLLLSFGFRQFYTGSVPGFDEAAYVANVLSFISGATNRINDVSIVKQLADGAISFLTDIANAPVLDARPELRTQAITAWRALSEKAASLGIILNTKLDGVIDPRPELRLVEPLALEGEGGDVWQVAASPDGRFIAQANGDRRIRVWDARTRALLKTIQLDDARQLYGDLANSLGVSWQGDQLLVTSLHDTEGRKSSFNLIRSFDLSSDKAVLTGADALTTAQVDDVYVLRENSNGVYASPKELRNEQSHYLGAEIRLINTNGQALHTIPNSVLLDLQEGRLLASAPGKSTPELKIFDLANPNQPQDVTPEWLKSLVAAWRTRNPQSEYGWWPTLSAKLGAYQGRPALLMADQGRLNIHDLATGALLRSLVVPSGWRITPYLTNAGGTVLAAIVTANGQFSGPNPERVVMWDLSTGELVMDHDATYVPTGWLYTRGQSIAQLEFSADGRSLIAAGRTGTLVFELP